jgi:hypothetical protein
MGASPAPTGRRIAALLCLLLPLAGCEAMNQVTVLDRIFEPERFGPKPAPPPQAAPAPKPAPAPAVVAMEPLPDPEPVPASPLAASPVAANHRPVAPPEDPEARLRQTVRQHPWLTRFWSELTITEQARIARQLPPDDDPPGTWDSMGLADRARLVGPPPDERRWASGR